MEVPLLGLPFTGIQHLSGRGGLVFFEEVINYSAKIMQYIMYTITAFLFSLALDVKQVAADIVVAWSNMVRSIEQICPNTINVSEALKIEAMCCHCASVACRVAAYSSHRMLALSLRKFDCQQAQQYETHANLFLLC